MPAPRHITLLFAAANHDETADLRQHLELACSSAEVQFDGSHAVPAGTQAADELARSVEAAQRVLCYVTVDLLADDALLALTRRAQAAGKLVPVLGRPCGWRAERAFAQLQPLPRDGRPLSQQDDREGVLADLVAEVLDQLIGSSLHQDGASTERREAAVDLFADLLRGYSSQVSVLVRSFLENYLGTATHPVPFGGRAEDLRTIHDWWEDRTAPPYLLLVAPTGIGKSALVCHLVQQQLKGDALLLFLPVSHRYRTNQEGMVAQAVVERLAQLRQDGRRPHSAATFADMAQALLRAPPPGRRLLVVMDGIDERAGWDLRPGLFPCELPAGTRVILSARLSHEIPSARSLGDQLGLAAAQVRAMTLGPLSEGGVTDVLGSIGLAWGDAAMPGTLAAQVHRVCAGDPLVLRLLLDELRSQHPDLARTPPDLLRALQGMRAGLSGVWERQLGALERGALEQAATRALLCLLACALGPLNRDDILRLAAAEIANVAMLRRVAAPVSRLILLEGQSYVFCHTRLREVFAEEHMSKEERQRWRGRIRADGAQVVSEVEQRRRAPREVPSYVLNYYGAHLEEAQAQLPERMALVSGGWMRAWQEISGGVAGFLADVHRAHELARKNDAALIDQGEPAAHIADTLRCALCAASARSAAYVEPELLQLFVKHGVWTPAQALARIKLAPTGMDVTPDRPGECLTALAPLLPDELLSQALELAVRFASESTPRATLDPWKALLPRLVRVLPVATLAARARSLRDAWARVDLLAELAQHAPSDAAALWCECREAVRRLKNIYCLCLLARRDPEQGPALLQEALALAMNLPEPAQRLGALSGLLEDLPAAQADEVCRAMVDDALLLCDEERQHAIFVITHKASAATLVELLPKLLAVLHLRLILGTNYLYQGLLQYTSVRRESSALPADLMGELGEAAKAAARQQWRDKRDGQVFARLAERGMGAFALALRQEVREEVPWWVDITLAPWLTTGECWQLFTDALAEASPARQKHSLPKLLDALPAERLDEALPRLLEMEPEVALSGLLTIHARVDADKQATVAQHAVDQARKLRDPSRRARALLEVLPLSPSPEVLQEAKEAILTVGAPEHQVSLFEELARGLREPWRSWVGRIILDLIETLDPWPRLHKLRYSCVSSAEELRADARALFFGTLRENPRLLRRSGWWGEVGPFTLGPPAEEDREWLLRETARQVERLGGTAALVSAVVALHPGERALRRLLSFTEHIQEPDERFRVLAYLFIPGCEALPALRAQSVALALAAAQCALKSRTVLGVRRFILRFASGSEHAAAVDLVWKEIDSICEHHQDWLRHMRLSPALDIGEELTDLRDNNTQDEFMRLHDTIREVGEFLPTDLADELVDRLPWQWSDLFGRLLPRLSPRVRETTVSRALEVARARGGLLQIGLQVAAIPHVAESRRDELIAEVLAAAHEAKQLNAGWVVAQLGPYFREEHLPWVIDLVWKHPGTVPPSLTLLLKALGEALRSQALEIILLPIGELADPDRQNHLRAIIAYLSGEPLHAALEAALGHCDQTTAQELCRAVPRLSDQALIQICDGMKKSRPVLENLALLGATGEELLKRSSSHRHRLWSLLDELLARDLGRQELLGAVEHLAPLLRRLGDAPAMAQALMDVMDFWR